MRVGDKIIIGEQLYKLCAGDTCAKCPFYSTPYCGEVGCGNGHYERDDTPITTDWNQIRIQAAIAAMQGYCSLQEVFVNYPEEQVAGFAVKQADALIEELKKEKK